jgi:vancomycin resistance protein YoaR
MRRRPTTHDDTIYDDTTHDTVRTDAVQDEPVPDETVRMRADRPDARPADAGWSSPAGNPDEVRQFDDTRPVTRDWLLGAPDAAREPAQPPVPPAPVAAPAAEAPSPVTVEDDDSTQTFDMAGPPGPPTADAEAEPGSRPSADDSDGGDTSDGPPPGDGPPGGGDRGPWWRRRAVLVPAGALAVLAAAYGADLLIASGDIPRSTVVAGIDIGGMSPDAAATALERRLAPQVVADHTVVADDVEATLSPATAGIMLDVDATVDRADDQPLNPWTRVVTLFSDREVDPVITGEDTALAAQIETIAAQVDQAPVDATIAIDGTTPSVVEASDGRTLDREGSADAITAALASGGDPDTPIDLPVDVEPVDVDAAEAQRVLEETVEPALMAPVSVVVQNNADTAEVSVEAIAASLTFTPQEDGVLTVSLDPAALQTALGDELAVFGSGAADARFELSGGAVTVVPSTDGTGVAPATLAEQLLPVLTEDAPRTVTAQLGPVPADFTTEEAQALGIKEEIGSFTTNIGNAASGENIRVVAAEVDGALVQPGETFSLNGFTGPRGLAQGYVEAGVINNGNFTTAVGGGISQFATTMFNAVFFSGLEDVFHKPHSYYISRYPAGREATVYYDSIDLKWRNDSDTGVYIDTAWTPGTITVTFYGTKRYEIQSISSDRYNARSPVVQEKPDDGSCKPQAGSTGFDITVTRVFRDLATGAEVQREDFQTRYAAEPVIRCIAATPPTPATPPAPAPDGSTPGG